MSERMSTAEFPGLLPGGSAVTGEAGTVSGQSGQYAPQGKAAGIHPPASRQAPQGRAGGLTFSLTEEQRSHLAFAALCEAEDLAEGYEADELEVQEAIRNLWEAHSILEGRSA